MEIFFFLTYRYLIGQYVTIHDDVISHINITSVNTMDGGLYGCTASNSIGSIIYSAKLNVYGKYCTGTQFDQSGSYTKLLHRSWKFHQLCILSSTIQWCYPKYWKSLCHFDPCLSMSIIIKIINFIESKIEFWKFCSYGVTIFNVLANATELWMTKYIITHSS